MKVAQRTLAPPEEADCSKFYVTEGQYLMNGACDDYFITFVPTHPRPDAKSILVTTISKNTVHFCILLFC